MNNARKARGEYARWWYTRDRRHTIVQVDDDNHQARLKCAECNGRLRHGPR